MLAQSKKIDRLQRQLNEAKEQLARKELNISEAGSIAEASLVLNNIFADAQNAADQYLDNIRLMHEQAEKELAEARAARARAEEPAEMPAPEEPASSTSLHASGINMKKRTIRSSVTVTGPPFLICSLNNGITEPLEPSTLPKRVVTNCVRTEGPPICEAVMKLSSLPNC